MGEAAGNITATCEHCGKAFVVGRALIGKKVRCKGCSQVFQIVDPDAAISDIALSDDPNDGIAPKIQAVGSGSGKMKSSDASRHGEGSRAGAKLQPLTKVAAASEDVALAMPNLAPPVVQRPLLEMAFAKELDELLPIVLTLLGIGWVFFESLRANDTGFGWTTFMRVFVFVALYTLIVWPACCIGARFCCKSSHVPAPRNLRWRVFGAMVFPAALVHILWSISGSLLAVLFGLIIGLGVALFAIAVLFRLAVSEMPSFLGQVTGWFIGTMAVAAGLYVGLNFVVHGTFVSLKIVDNYTGSPIGRFLPWEYTPAPDPNAAKKSPTIATNTPDKSPKTNGTTAANTTAANTTPANTNPANPNPTSPTPDNTGPTAASGTTPPADPNAGGDAPKGDKPKSITDGPGAAEIPPEERPVVPGVKPEEVASLTHPADKGNNGTNNSIVQPDKPGSTLFDPNPKQPGTGETPTVVVRPSGATVTISDFSKIGPFNRAIVPMLTSKYVATIRQLTNEQDAVEIWCLDPIEKKAAFEVVHDPGSEVMGTLSASGKYWTQIKTFPKLGITIRTIGDEKPPKSIEFNKTFGDNKPVLWSFLDENLFAVKWQDANWMGFELYDASSGQRKPQTIDLQAYSEFRNKVRLSADGKMLAVYRPQGMDGNGNMQPGRLDVYGTKGGQITKKCSFGKIELAPTAIAFSPDGKQISVTVERQNQVAVLTWSFSNPPDRFTECLIEGFRPEPMSHNRPRQLDYTADGKNWVIFGQAVYEVGTAKKIADLSEGKVVRQWVADAKTIYLVVEQSDRSQMLVSAKLGGN